MEDKSTWWQKSGRESENGCPLGPKSGQLPAMPNMLHAVVISRHDGYDYDHNYDCDYDSEKANELEFTPIN